MIRTIRAGLGRAARPIVRRAKYSGQPNTVGSQIDGALPRASYRIAIDCLFQRAFTRACCGECRTQQAAFTVKAAC